MLHRGKDVLLKAAHPRGSHQRAEIGILTRAFGDPAPARIARDVYHRRVRPVDAKRRGLLSRRTRRRLGGVGIERPRFRERNREDGAIAVDHVEAEQQRDLETRLRHGDALHGRRVLGAHDVEQPAEFPRAHELHLLRRGAPAGRQEIELAEFFFEGHAGEEGIEILGGRGGGQQNREN